ncbi:MAG: T9SS type A sorting domain-containing protein, partial [Bacteroidota bacterium]
GSTVEHIVYTDGDEGTVVEHFRITGGGHTWPDENTNAPNVNRYINGCEEIWKFFSRFDIDGAINFTTAVETIINTVDIKVYPNPTHDYIHIQAEKAVPDVTIINATGQEFVLPVSSVNSQCQVNVSSLTSGLYFIFGTTDLGTFQSSFIKR